MADTGTETHGARPQHELDYETAAMQLRERIVQLITDFADIEAEAEALQPSIDDDNPRLDEIEARVRRNITDLQQISAHYDQAVTEWNQLDQAHGIMTSDSPWTRSMYAFRKKCLNAKSNKPMLTTKVNQLILAYDRMITAIAEFRDDRAHGRTGRTPSPNPGQNVQSPRPLGSPAHSAGDPIVTSPPASTGGPSLQLAPYNPLRVFELARRYMPSFGLGATPPPTQPSPIQGPTRPPLRPILRRTTGRVPITTQLDHGDDTPVSQTYRTTQANSGTRYRDDRDGRGQPTFGHSPTGIMGSVDPRSGNISHTRSMAWDNSYRPMQQDRAPRGSFFYSDGTTTAPAASSRSGFPPHSGDIPPGPRPHSGPTPDGLPPHSGENRTRLDSYDLPPYVSPTHEVNRMTDDFSSLAAGRGSETSPRITTPLTATMDVASDSAAPSSKPSSSTATAASKEAETAFYRNSRFVRRTCPDAALPPNLVLKALPLKPFEGDVRSYPEFRDNFLELIETQPHLSPQQKLQYLVNHLKGAPLQMAEGFGFSEGSYCEVIELLEARYGDEIVLQNLLLQDLVALESPAARPSDLAAFHRNALQIYQRLKRAGMDMDGNPVCNQLLLGKLPQTIKLKVMEKADEKGRVSTSVQLKEILTHINSLQRAQTAGLTFTTPSSRGTTQNRSRPNSRPGSPGPPQGNGAHHRPPYNTGTYAADTEQSTYVASKQQRRQRCAFCGEHHWSARCTIYPTVAIRIRRLEQLKQCFFCLGGGHWSSACPHRSPDFCKVCQKAHHHVAPCRTYMGESRPGTPQPTPVKSPKPAGGFGSSTAGVPTAQRSISAGESTASPAGGATRSPDGGSSTPRRTPTNTVIGKKEAAGASPANNVRPPSAQNSQDGGPGNSKNDRKQQRRKNNNKKGANFSKQGGTPCHAAATSDENTMQKSGEACSDAGLLPGHQALLQTVRCSNPSESAPFDREAGRDFDEYSTEAVVRQLKRPDDEEISLPESHGHESNPDFEEFEGIDDQYWHPPDDGYAVSETAPADTQAVLLECIKVTAVNPLTGASREAIAFFDSGSSATFSSTELAADLGLPRHEARTFYVNTFASNKATVIEGYTTSLILRSPQGQEVHLDATASDHGVKSVRTALVTRDELPLLHKNACTLISTRERPDLLIGQDTVKLFKRRFGPDLPSGFHVIQTVLGPMVGGPGRATTAESRDVHVATSPPEPDTPCQQPQMIVVDIMDRSQKPARTKPPTPPKKSTTASPVHSTGKALRTGSRPPHSGEKIQRTLLEETVSGYLSGLVEKSDAELLGDFSHLENAGMGTYEIKPDDQTATDMLKSMHVRELDGRFNVPLLFRTANGEPPSNEQLPTNAPLAKGRAISTRNSLAKDPKKLADYHEIVCTYLTLGFIGAAPRMTPYTKHCLSHHPVFKETSTTTATRPVFDASAKLPGRTCLNDWVFQGPNLLPTVPAILLRSRFPTIIIVSDIGKAFLQMSVKESHRDYLRWFWFKDPFAEPTEDNIVEYRFNRVPFGLKSSPYLLAGVIKMHLESEGTPLALEMLKNCYVDNVLLLADTVDEALTKYRDSKAIFAKIQMTLREYASNNAAFNNAIDQADRADLEKLRELGIRWDVTADYWDIPLRPKPPLSPIHSIGTDSISILATSEVPTHSVGPSVSLPTKKKPKRKRGKKTDDNRLTKRTMLRLVAQIFDPMGLVQAATLLAKLAIQEVWKIENDWDDEVDGQLKLLWEEAIRDFDQTVIRIPRRLAKGKIKSVEIHVFTDGSSQAYGFTAYLRIKDTDKTYRTNLVYARARVKPIKDADKYTIPRMELLGVLVGRRAIKFLHEEITVTITATYLWSDSTIVLHQIADQQKIKDVWVENRLLEVRQVRDAHNVQFRHVPTADNPADIVSRGMAAKELQNCAKWWFGPEFLSREATLWPPGPTSLAEGTHSVPDPPSDLDKYGSTSFAALYVNAFTPEEQIPKRKLRSRKKPNPLDTITEPLPTTTVMACAIATLGHVTHSVISLPPLPSSSLLPLETEQKFPSWPRQVRITYYVLRFAAAYLRKKVVFKPNFTQSLGFDLADSFDSPRPTLKDLNVAELIMLRKTQLRHPPSAADRRNLGIFEHQGLLYVKGRLGNMKMRPSALTPLYLPKEAKETELLIVNYHRINCHSGVQDTLANIRMRYWFTSGRRTVRRAIYKNCFPCRREALHPYASPPWPQLPTTRVTQARPFLCTGLDFFGPCQIRAPHPDGGYELKKYYVAIFVCMTYRCVHLELCADLSTEEFLHALRRFGSRREYPARILSDNGQSFLTARQIISQIRPSHAQPRTADKRRNPVRKTVSARLSTRGKPPHSGEVPSSGNPPPPRLSTLTPEEERLIDFCQNHKIEWQTITELSPWRGGVYERLIGLIKHCLRRSIGRTKPTVVEFSSLLAEAERTANSRPLSYIADSDTDFYLVRPLDILHPLLREEAPQNPLDPQIEEDCDPNDPDFVGPGENRLHVKLIQSLKKSRRAADIFWTEFRNGYLQDLLGRGVNRKYNQFGEPTIQLGDLVLIKEPDVPRCDWRLALVIELLPDQDGLIRTARVRFSRTHQEHTRALEHLYPIGNIPRVPARCDTTAFADVYSLSSISESDNVMASNSNATTVGPDETGQDALTNIEATIRTQPTTPQPTHSVGGAPPNPTHSVGGVVEAPELPYSGTRFAAFKIPALHARCNNLYKSIISTFRRAENAATEEERNDILANMDETTKSLVDAGPRADPVNQDQEEQTEDSGCPETSDNAAAPSDDEHSPEEAATQPQEVAQAPPIMEPSEVSQQTTDPTFAQSMFPSQRANTNRSGTTCTRVFRGRNAFKMQRSPTSRPPYQPPAESQAVAAPKEDSPQESPAHSAGSPAQTPSASLPPPTGSFAVKNQTRGQNAPRRGGRMRMTVTQLPPYLSPEFPDTDPPTIADDSWTTATPPAAEPRDSSAHSAGTEPQAAARPTHPVGRRAQLAAQTPTAQTAPTTDPDLLPPQRLLLDGSTLPTYPTLANVKRLLSPLIVEETRNGQTIKRYQDHILSTFSIAEPQNVGFGFNTKIHRDTSGRPTDHIWDPVTVCNGQGENVHRFHQSLHAFRIIIKTTWRGYTVIAGSGDLQKLLDHVLSLHVKCFGQMILLTYVTVDFEWKIPRLLTEYYPKITEGLPQNVDPLPNDGDFQKAAEYWLNYCHKAFIHFIEHLTGWPLWNPDWLESEELLKDLRNALRAIQTKAPWILQELRERAYKHYVLRYTRALENDDQSYRWTRLTDPKKDVSADSFLTIKRTSGRYVMFVDDDIFHSPISKLLKKEVQIIRIDSDNRTVVLGTLRSYLPGPETAHVIFWFGRQYINNGNEDYGNLMTEICFYYSSIFGRVRQYVILPPYNRLHRQVWTGQALCLYAQKELLVPYAQVVLHPYDARFWLEDQALLDAGQALPQWTNTKQSVDGKFYKEGALEARKYVLRDYHGIDLWTWYQKDHHGERPPVEIDNFYQRKAVNQTPALPQPPHSGVGNPQSSASVLPPPAAAAALPSTSAGPPSVNPPTNVVNIFGERALADIFQQVVQQATIQISAVLDEKLSRIEAMIQDQEDDQSSNATAEDRQQDTQDKTSW
ncbi:Pao retrotransposon peptidase family protein [Aphelenchoides avenae]|nr:Pao retrotransposon peptidase family protein [Aphelenchus avenae]